MMLPLRTSNKTKPNQSTGLSTPAFRPPDCQHVPSQRRRAQVSNALLRPDIPLRHRLRIVRSNQMLFLGRADNSGHRYRRLRSAAFMAASWSSRTVLRCASIAGQAMPGQSVCPVWWRHWRTSFANPRQSTASSSSRPARGTLISGACKAAWRLTGSTSSVFAFVLMNHDDEDVRPTPLDRGQAEADRARIALRFALPSPVQVFDDSVKLLEAAERHGLDGIVSKRQASAYRSSRPRQQLGELQTGIAAAKNSHAQGCGSPGRGTHAADTCGVSAEDERYEYASTDLVLPDGSTHEQYRVARLGKYLVVLPLLSPRGRWYVVPACCGKHVANGNAFLGFFHVCCAAAAIVPASVARQIGRCPDRILFRHRLHDHNDRLSVLR